jgi:hypothetical protein
VAPAARTPAHFRPWHVLPSRFLPVPGGQRDVPSQPPREPGIGSEF